MTTVTPVRRTLDGYGKSVGHDVEVVIWLEMHFYGLEIFCNTSSSKRQSQYRPTEVGNGVKVVRWMVAWILD